MKTLFRIHFLPILAAVVLSMGLQLNAQQSYPGAQPSQAQQPAQPPNRSNPPDAQSQNPQSQAPTDQAGGQVFTGTIVKSGNRYMLQDADSGKMYDIDRQDLAANHVGKQVRVPGTLDADGKTIHVGK
jgi:hypothetical protein